MQPHPRRAVTTSVIPLIGFASLMTMSGCAAIPAMNLANSLMKPAQPTASDVPSPDVFTSLAQRLGITLAPQPAATPTGTQTATDTPTTASKATTTAAK